MISSKSHVKFSRFQIFGRKLSFDFIYNGTQRFVPFHFEYHRLLVEFRLSWEGDILLDLISLTRFSFLQHFLALKPIKLPQNSRISKQVTTDRPNHRLTCPPISANNASSYKGTVKHSQWKGKCVNGVCVCVCVCVSLTSYDAQVCVTVVSKDW